MKLSGVTNRVTVGNCAVLISAALVFTSCGGGATARSVPPREAARYSHQLHSRFYEAWVQPQNVGAPRGRISVPVNVRIDPDGRVVSFKPVRLSGYPRIDESVLAVGARVKKVPAPPHGGEFRLRVYFDLDVKT